MLSTNKLKSLFGTCVPVWLVILLFGVLLIWLLLVANSLESRITAMESEVYTTSDFVAPATETSRSKLEIFEVRIKELEGSVERLKRKVCKSIIDCF